MNDVGSVVNGFFQLDPDRPDGRLLPERAAASMWGGSGNHMRGMAVSGALARSVEHVTCRGSHAQLRPVRWHLELFRPAAMVPCEVGTTVVRAGRRLSVIDAELRQDEVVVARASALFLAAGEQATGTVWTADPGVEPPPPDLRPTTTEPRLYHSAGLGWTGSPESHGDARRKQVWILPVPVVTGEPVSPFQLAAMAADVVSAVSHWGSGGLEFINVDVSLAMSRLPVGDGIGLAAQHRTEDHGLATGSATLFDRVGPIGVGTVAAMLAPYGAVDPRRNGVPLGQVALPTSAPV